MQKRWQALARTVLLQGQAALAAVLTGTTLIAIDDGVLTIEVAAGSTPPPADFADQLRPHLSTLASPSGASAALRLTIVHAADPAGDDRSNRFHAAQSHPLVRDLLKRFEGEVIRTDLESRAEWLARLERNG